MARDGDPRRVAFVLQIYGLVPILSAGENVAIALRARGVAPGEADERADEELARFHIGDLGDRQVEELSGGQMQRVAWPAPLRSRPTSCSPTSPPASSTRPTASTWWPARVEAARGAIVVVATHDPAVADQCDDELHLVDGQVKGGRSHGPDRRGRSRHEHDMYRRPRRHRRGVAVRCVNVVQIYTTAAGHDVVALRGVEPRHRPR